MRSTHWVHNCTLYNISVHVAHDMYTNDYNTKQSLHLIQINLFLQMIKLNIVKLVYHAWKIYKHLILISISKIK